MVTIINSKFDRGILTWLQAAANEYTNTKVKGELRILSAVEDEVYYFDINGYRFEYTAMLSDTIDSIVDAFKSMIDASDISKYLLTSVIDSVLIIEAVEYLYGLYIIYNDDPTTANISFVQVAGIPVIWVDQNAYDARQDYKPKYPFITVDVTYVTDSTGNVTESVYSNDDEWQYNMNMSVMLTIKFFSTNSFVTFADRCSKSYKRRLVINRFFRPNGLSCFGIYNRQNISRLLNSKTELCMEIGIKFNYVDVLIDKGVDVSYIECVEINGEKIVKYADAY